MLLQIIVWPFFLFGLLVLATAAVYGYFEFRRRHPELTKAVGDLATTAKKGQLQATRLYQRKAVAEALNADNLVAFVRAVEPEWSPNEILVLRNEILPTSVLKALAHKYVVQVFQDLAWGTIFKVERDPLPEEGNMPTAIYFCAQRGHNDRQDVHYINDAGEESKDYYYRLVAIVDLGQCEEQCRLDFQREIEDFVRPMRLTKKFKSTSAVSAVLAYSEREGFSVAHHSTANVDPNQLAGCYEPLRLPFAGKEVAIDQWLDRVSQWLADDSVYPSLALCGQPGVGKTTLIDHLAGGATALDPLLRVVRILDTKLLLNLIGNPASMLELLQSYYVNKERILFILDEATNLTIATAQALTSLMENATQKQYRYSFLCATNSTADDMTADFPALCRPNRLNLVTVPMLEASTAENLHKLLKGDSTKVEKFPHVAYTKKTSLATVIHSFSAKKSYMED